MVGTFGNEIQGRLAKSSKPFDGEGYELQVIMISEGTPIFRSFGGLIVSGGIPRLKGGANEEMAHNGDSTLTHDVLLTCEVMASDNVRAKTTSLKKPKGST
mmetsp:Transcript_24276/g.35015  ORF Transcript_24276/g.35015 Transcript_24276/m.35015 type:complete len:101 (-) Transcript_24276:1515-1817(-)